MACTFDRSKTALADRHAIEREIGAGDLATVYLAEDLHRERKEVLEGVAAGFAVNVRASEFAVLADNPRFREVMDAWEQCELSDPPSGPRR